MAKYVYMFKEGNASMRDLLGGKGANLAEMTRLKLPVPQGFVVSTEACNDYYKKGKKLTKEMTDQILKAVVKLEKINGKKFGDIKNPLLISVRSGARVSMPGMMDTVLNVGLNDVSVEGIAKGMENPRFAYDSYRRLIQMFANVVMNQDISEFEKILEETKKKKQVESDIELDADDMKEIVNKYKALYKKQLKQDFPQDPTKQLLLATEGVFASWNNDRAIKYRRINKISDDWGTAVNIQTMVFGNMGEDSGTGVAFSRNPATGENKLYGEYLFNAQGEDLVSGVRTPIHILELEKKHPLLYKQFHDITKRLEKHYKDMQDLEFSIEKGKLYILQTRNGKRTAAAALKIAIDMVEEKILTKKQALLKINANQINDLLHPRFDFNSLKKAKVLAKGLASSPGAGTGVIAIDSAMAVKFKNEKKKSILVRNETSAEDIEGMSICAGVLTSTGGRTSHAAVVARGMGTPCVVGASDVKVDEKKRTVTINGKEFKEGDEISVNGTTGNVYAGSIKTSPASMSDDFKTIMAWANEFKVLGVRANADTPTDTKQAVKFGAEGVGLVRTEHMFFKEGRIEAIRAMIIAETKEEREKALKRLLPMQRKDFEGIFKEAGERTVTIRLIDPPLHEFLPKTDEDTKDLAKTVGITIKALKEKMESLEEFNPMLGHRGCRLLITYPEITAMQTRAIIEAAVNLTKKTGVMVVPEIMIPLVGDLEEFRFVKKQIVATAKQVMEEKGVIVNYKVGTMIEVPRAALLADKIAKEADFFSFGTNDLTQMTFGFSRDDSSKFIEDYHKNKVLTSDPFRSIDEDGVGALVKMATKLGRDENKHLKLGICGEHGGDPASIEFFHNTGLTYVSCSPYRVPVAKLSAAQAAIKEKK